MLEDWASIQEAKMDRSQRLRWNKQHKRRDCYDSYREPRKIPYGEYEKLASQMARPDSHKGIGHSKYARTRSSAPSPERERVTVWRESTHKWRNCRFYESTVELEEGVGDLIVCFKTNRVTEYRRFDGESAPRSTHNIRGRRIDILITACAKLVATGLEAYKFPRCPLASRLSDRKLIRMEGPHNSYSVLI